MEAIIIFILHQLFCPLLTKILTSLGIFPALSFNMKFITIKIPQELLILPQKLISILYLLHGFKFLLQDIEFWGSKAGIKKLHREEQLYMLIKEIIKEIR